MLKTLIAVAAGSVVTFGLFFLMQALIASGQSAMTDAADRRGRQISSGWNVRKRWSESSPNQNRPSNPEAPPPDAPQPSIDQSADIGGQAIAGLENVPVAAGRLDFDIGTGFGIAAGSADGDYLPLVRVAPIYPRRARARNIEGWVILELTVSEAGAVKDPHVISYHPSEIFNRAAINAARKFKYKPRVVNGKPIEVRGVRYKLTFKLVD